MKMKRLGEKGRYLPWLVFAGTLFVLVFFLARYTVYTLNSDASSELVLAKHLADQGGGLLSKNWYYSTEIRILSEQLAFELMFFLTDSWSAVRLGGTLILIALLTVSLYYFCRQTVGRECFPITAVFILLPLSRNYFDYALKFTYYIPYIVIEFVVIGAAVQFAKGLGKGRYAAMTLALLLSLDAGMLGFRMLLTLFIPLVLAVLLYLWLNKSPDGSGRLVKSTGLLTTAALIGCLINQTLIEKQYTFHDYTTLSFTGFSLNGLEKTIAGLLNILGYRSGEPVFSKALLPSALSAILLLLCIYCGVYVLVHRDRFNAGQQIAAGCYLFAILVLCLLYSLTDMEYMSYHSIQAMVQGLPLLFMCFGREELFGKAGRRGLAGLMCFALLCSALHYNDMRKQDDTRALREAAQFLAQSDYKEGYASFWIGNLATELSNGQAEVWVWNDIGLAELSDPDDIVPWLQSKDHDAPPEGKVFILLTANEAYYCNFTRSFTEENVIFTTAGYEPGAVDEYIIYGFDSYQEMRALFLEGVKGE